MSRLRPGTKARLLTLTLTMLAFLGTSSFLLARQTSPQPKSQPHGEPGSEANPQPDSPKTKSTTKAKSKSKDRARRDPPGFYMGRRIADVMSWEGVDWLFRETRVDEEQPEAMLDALKVPRGATVADVGAGAGYHSIRLARRVGPRGTVLATDIQPEMLRMLQANAREAGVTNIKSIRSTQNDPKLQEGSVDLILMVDVYHECSTPERTLLGLLKALKPRGRLVLVEFRGEDPDVPIKPEHKMTLDQVRREVEPQGFLFKESLEFLPWQHVIIFEKPADTKSDTNRTPAGAPDPKPKSP
jgi:ubiquinone/menaquinone biosynthesis C-methylase UbiE